MFNKIFGRFLPDMSGLALQGDEFWEIDPCRDVSLFLRCLNVLLPSDAITYFEDPGEKTVIAFLRERAVSPRVKLARGTIWPNPSSFHLPLCAMEDLASLIDSQSIAYVCAHFHAYHNDQVLLQWHDAFWDVPMLVARSIPESRVQTFGNALRQKYRLARGVH